MYFFSARILSGLDNSISIRLPRRFAVFPSIPGIPDVPENPGRDGMPVSRVVAGEKGEPGERGNDYVDLVKSNWKQCAWKRGDRKVFGLIQV